MNGAYEKPPLAPPRGAATSGVIFAVLAIIGIGLVRYAIPSDVRAPGEWLTEPHHRRAVLIALRFVPFSGIAFLWFIGVLRNRLGQQEDQFYATVFLASGLLFVATLFAGATATEALVEAIASGNSGGETYYLARVMSDVLFNLYSMKMAGVFMFSTCTIGLRTNLFSRWVAYLGYAAGLLLLLIIADWRWITLVFPIWMLVVSCEILLAGPRTHPASRRK